MIREWIETAGVSIHVPARGTTNAARNKGHGRRVSIHVPARGTTEFDMEILSIVWGFNPRSREGNDGYKKLITYILDNVSIHVPARGTTHGS